MYSIRRQLTVALFAVTLAAIASAPVLAQSGPVGAPQSDVTPMPQPNRVTFTKESLPQLLKQLGFTVTEKASANGPYWQVVTQLDGWSFTVQVFPMMNQDKITCLLLSSDLGKKIQPQAGAQDLLKVMQWNHQGAYLMYFGYNAQTGCITAQRPYVFNDGSVDEMRQLFQDYFKTIRDTHAVWNAPSSAAAAPAGNGNLTPASPAPAKPAPAAAEPANIAGSTWNGNENLPGFGKLTFVFRAGGAATMIDAKGQAEGTWTQTGNDVTINFQGCVYQGRINGQTLAGSGRITAGAQDGQTWSFQVALQKN